MQTTQTSNQNQGEGLRGHRFGYKIRVGKGALVMTLFYAHILMYHIGMLICMYIAKLLFLLQFLTNNHTLSEILKNTVLFCI